MSNPLHTKYRPCKFSDVVGQAAVVASLQKVLAQQFHYSRLMDVAR